MRQTLTAFNDCVYCGLYGLYILYAYALYFLDFLVHCHSGEFKIGPGQCVRNMFCRRTPLPFRGGGLSEYDIFDRERKCADTIGTVPVPWAGHFQC